MAVNEKEMPGECDKLKVEADLEIEQYALLIQTAGNRLGCDVVTVAKAMMLGHHFEKLMLGNGQDFDQNSLAIACLALSCKISDIDFEFSKKILYKVYGIKKNQRDSMKAFVENVHAYVIKLEYVVCQALNWNFFWCETAHKYVFLYLEMIKATPSLESVFDALSSHISKVIATFYLCKKCVAYKPEEIALAVMQMGLQYVVVDVSCVKYLKNELTTVSTEELIGNIVDDMIIVSDVSTASV